MTNERIRAGVEATARRVFVVALEWPGWVRSGKTKGLAVEALLAAAPRYRGIAELPSRGVDLTPCTTGDC